MASIKDRDLKIAIMFGVLLDRVEGDDPDILRFCRAMYIEDTEKFDPVAVLQLLKNILNRALK